MKLNQTLELEQDLEAARREAEKQTERSVLEVELREVYTGLVNLKTVSNQARNGQGRTDHQIIKPTNKIARLSAKSKHLAQNM